MTTKLYIHAYVTNLGLIFKLNNTNYPYYSSIGESFKLNGVRASTFQKMKTIKGEEWYLFPGCTSVTTVTKETHVRGAQDGWKLVNPRYASSFSSIPLKLSMSDMFVDEDGNYSGNFLDFRSLYEPTYSEPTTVEEPVEFDFVKLGDINVTDFDQPEKMTIQVTSDRKYPAEVQEVDLLSVTTFYTLEQLLTPSFMLHKRPCYLSSHQVYQIVRAHVKSIYNPQKFKITSDYDFCFTVKKVVNTKPFTKVISKSVRKGRGWTEKHVPETCTTKEIEVFSMTYAGYNGSPSGYKGHPVIKDWKANSLKELHDTVKEYLDELTTFLLSDVQECTHCSGVGYFVPNNESIADRCKNTTK